MKITSKVKFEVVLLVEDEIDPEAAMSTASLRAKSRAHEEIGEALKGTALFSLTTGTVLAVLLDGSA